MLSFILFYVSTSHLSDINIIILGLIWNLRNTILTLNMMYNRFQPNIFPISFMQCLNFKIIWRNSNQSLLHKFPRDSFVINVKTNLAYKGILCGSKKISSIGIANQPRGIICIRIKWFQINSSERYMWEYVWFNFNVDE